MESKMTVLLTKINHRVHQMHREPRYEHFPTQGGSLFSL